MQYRIFLIALVCFLGLTAGRALAAVPFQIAFSEAVTVTGAPRLSLDVGGATRYAAYASGSGTATLTFSYAVQPGDFDADGVALVSPLDLNGGSLKDGAGNDAALTFTPPNTSGIKIQAYQAAFTTSPITSANATAAAFDITGAPVSAATYAYTITSDGGAGSVTGSGNISADPQSVTGVNVSGLPPGTLTLSLAVTNATGTGEPVTATVPATSTFAGALDNLPASAAAYSVRRLRSAYTGSLIRVRRSNDNSEQDIGYTGSGDLNTGSLTSFCGANSCYVRTWYDQSGNGRNAVQMTTGQQPRIVNAGTVEIRNTRPAVKFLGSGYDLRTGAFTAFSTGFSLFAVAKVDTDSTYNALITKTDTLYPAPVDIYNNTVVVGDNGTYAFIGLSASFSAATPYSVWSFTVANTGATEAYFNGFANGSGTAGSYGDTGQPVILGSRADSFTTLNGIISEGVLFASVLSTTNRQALENNQKAYYGTP